MTTTIQHWRAAWERAESESDVNVNAGKTLNLLSQYAGFYKSIPLLGLPVAWGGNCGRFFSGRWHTQHGDQVQNAIGNFYHMDSYYALAPKFHTVEFILSCVKKEIGDTPLNPNGRLAKILTVIKEKTNVDFAVLDADVIQNNYLSDQPTF
jgi:hypothetical protein